MSKILVADPIAQDGIAILEREADVHVKTGMSPDALVAAVNGYDALVVRSESKVTAEVFAAAKQLRAVGRAGVGVDNIDLVAATERGVIVMNTPSGNTIATAELTFTHILCGARPVPQAAASMREGKWDRKSFSGIELFKKTLGVMLPGEYCFTTGDKEIMEILAGTLEVQLPGSRAWKPSSSVAPWTVPALMPAPANQTVKPCGWWSRPSLPPPRCSSPGVRPNSVQKTTSTSFIKPRCFKSFSSPATGRSTMPHIFSWLALSFWCESQVPYGVG